MRSLLIIQKTVVLLLSALIMLQFSGCRSLSTLPRSEIQYAEKQHYYIHGQNISYQVSGTTMSEGTFTGIISNPIDAPPKGKVMHIYVAPDSVVSVVNNVVSVPFSNIAKAEVYNIDTGKTILIGAGAANAAFWSTLVIAFLTKDMSCPFVYSEDGTDINFEGEAYSGATAVPIERNDYLTMKSIAPVDNQYKIRITNEVREIQNTNLAELQIFDHNPDAEILVDKYGTAHSISAIKKPVTAINAYGRSILSELSYCDSARYISDIRNDKLLLDTIRLTFEKPKQCSHAKLVISGKNTMWLDYMFARLSDLFGSRYDEWVARRNKRSPEYLLQWSLDQGIPLAVYLETKSGLEFIDYYNVPGPAAYKKDVLQIDVSGVSGDRVNVVLVSGVLFWDIDYAGMDFTDDSKMVKTIVSLDYAADETGREVSSLLRYDDDKYLVQPLINNEARLTFKVPPPSPGKTRTVILHSKGNYEPIRTAEGKPDLELLKGMLKPGMFIRFTKDHFLKYYAHLN
jgi:hypothetical protein